MAGPWDSGNARVRVSTTSSGTYANVGFVRSAEMNRGSEGATTLRWLGGEQVKAGDITLAGSLPVWWDDADTTGQDILEAAWSSGADVWLQICPKGTATGAKVKQFSAKITEAPITFDSTGDAVEGTFTYMGAPSTLTTVTLA